MTNCCLIDFKGMLAQGFKIGNADVESPKSIQTATLRFHKSLLMWPLVNMVAAQLTVSMKFWRPMRNLTTKSI